MSLIFVNKIMNLNKPIENTVLFSLFCVTGH